MEWCPIWSQSMRKALFGGMMSGKNRTVSFKVISPIEGDKIRFHLSNRYNKRPYKVGGIGVWGKAGFWMIAKDGKKAFEIPAGEQILSDAVAIKADAGEELEIRIFYTERISDCNMTIEEASVCKGNCVETKVFTSLPVSAFSQKNGLYQDIPVIEKIEILTEQSAKVIVAFGDSITAMNRWVKPLRARLIDVYGSEFVLLNAGISGNCLLYDMPGIIGDSFGEKGIDRFERDVMQFHNLHAVILGIGINDVACYRKKTEVMINFETFTSEIRRITVMLKKCGIRVIMQILSPRKGYTGFKYTQEMEMLRVKINEWIRGADIFDYVFDADAVVRDPITSDQYKDGLHQGDYLHPNAYGGQMLAKSYDLRALTGK